VSIGAQITRDENQGRIAFNAKDAKGTQSKSKSRNKENEKFGRKPHTHVSNCGQSFALYPTLSDDAKSTHPLLFFLGVPLRPLR
jgi:hypothetical protein